MDSECIWHYHKRFSCFILSNICSLFTFFAIFSTSNFFYCHYFLMPAIVSCLFFIISVTENTHEAANWFLSVSSFAKIPLALSQTSFKLNFHNLNLFYLCKYFHGMFVLIFLFFSLKSAVNQRSAEKIRAAKEDISAETAQNQSKMCFLQCYQNTAAKFHRD